MKTSKSSESQSTRSTPELDLSFGTGGMVQIPSPFDPSLPLDTLFVVADPNTSTHQPIYAVCWQYDETKLYHYLVRLSEDGEIDRLFGQNGYFTPPSINSRPLSFRELFFSSDNGAITGISSILFDNSWYVPAATRLTVSGRLDTSFSGSGYRYYQPPWLPKSTKTTKTIANTEKTDVEDIPAQDQKRLAEAGLIKQLSILPDGKILFLATYRQYPNGYGVGSYLARINLDGSPDDTYGQNGFVKIEDPEEPDFIIYRHIYDVDRSGGMVLFVDRRNTSAVHRYDADGRLDQSFGTGGILVITELTNGSKTHAIKALDDGSIILLFDFSGTNDAGYRYFYPAAIKLLRDGSRDPAFNNGEPLKFDDLAPDATLETRGMTLDTANRIVIAGRAISNTYQHGFLARLFPNGTRDTDFGDNGLALLTDIDDLSAPSIQNGTKILSTVLVNDRGNQAVVRFIA